MDRSIRRTAAVVSMGAMVAGCGQSLRFAVEGDMRFEHCYRVDDDPRTPIDTKRACWRDWSSQYTRGQERSRVEYARARIRVLDGAASGGATVAVIAAPGEAPPAPASPYVPPPSTQAPTSADVSASINAGGVASTQRCSDACSASWRACFPACGGVTSCTADCDARLRACAKVCL